MVCQDSGKKLCFVGSLDPKKWACSDCSKFPFSFLFFVVRDCAEYYFGELRLLRNSLAKLFFGARNAQVVEEFLGEIFCGAQTSRFVFVKYFIELGPRILKRISERDSDSEAGFGFGSPLTSLWHHHKNFFQRIWSGTGIVTPIKTWTSTRQKRSS